MSKPASLPCKQEHRFQDSSTAVKDGEKDVQVGVLVLHIVHHWTQAASWSTLPVKSRQRFRSGLVQSCHSAELNKDCSSILRMLQWLVESKHSEIIFIAHPKNKPATRHTSCLPPRCHSEKSRVNKTKRHSLSKKDVLLPPLPGFALKLLRCPVWPSNTLIYALSGI